MGEAGAEGGLRLAAKALLGPGDLGGVAGQEVIHRLRRSQPGDRRQHAERVAGQHEHVLRLAAATGQVDVRDELDRVAGPGVLGQRIVRKSRLPCRSPTTFSSTDPKRLEAAQISGSASCDRLMTLA